MKNVVYLGTPGILLYNVRAKTQSLLFCLISAGNHLANYLNIFTVPLFIFPSLIVKGLAVSDITEKYEFVEQFGSTGPKQGAMFCL